MEPGVSFVLEPDAFRFRMSCLLERFALAILCRPGDRFVPEIQTILSETQFGLTICHYDPPAFFSVTHSVKDDLSYVVS